MKLHIGGREAQPGWKLLNIQAGPEVDYVGDISDLSEFENDSLDEAYASHVLEHVPQARMLDTLKGIHRVLTPGGKFMISVPDLDVLCHTMISPHASAEVKFHAMRMIFGGQVDANDYHYFGWTYQFMHSFLGMAGFSAVTRVQDFGLFNDTSNFKPYGFAISLNVVAVK
ncbi:MAG: methyltransferase domain-containing protein [Burkholderiaceae bacterium]|nr:methyltransferase domain-containing protein [Burkholderiaceae bacterium]MDH3460529.1 methyltransferase domain-containing protein [Burkholderiaceae bacterium]